MGGGGWGREKRTETPFSFPLPSPLSPTKEGLEKKSVFFPPHSPRRLPNRGSAVKILARNPKQVSLLAINSISLPRPPLLPTFEQARAQQWHVPIQATEKYYHYFPVYVCFKCLFVSCRVKRSKDSPFWK